MERLEATEIALGERESAREGSSARVRAEQPPVAARSFGSAKTETIGASKTETTKESGEKGGTQDINIGVGELEECAEPASPRPVLPRG